MEIDESIKAKLIVDEGQMLNRLADLATNFIQIEKNGTPVIATTEKPKDKMHLLFMIIGDFLAKQLALRDKDSTSSERLAELTGISGKTISARMSELKNDLVEKTGTGQFKIKSVAAAVRFLEGV